MPDPSEINRIVRDIDELPTIPTVANRILELTTNMESTSISELGKTIAADEALTVKILKISNSPFYGCQREISTVPRAIMILGLSAIKNLVMAASIEQVYKRFGLKEQLLWEHSIGCAIASHIIAKKVRFAHSEEALSGGLLHDIGKVVLNTKTPERYQTIVERVYNNGEIFFDVENEEYGFNHCDVGIHVVKKWNLSQALEHVVFSHHEHIASLPLDSDIREFIAVVSFADLCCLKLGIGYKSAQEHVDLENCSAIEILKFAKDEIDALLPEIREAYEKEKSLFS
ncbi:MAG: HDOD domain-containing protein [Thermodesulfobacteriota bacterium]|nr:HDOD domain-containing protein [Thermodesulfobacteriota bacterium]